MADLSDHSYVEVKRLGLANRKIQKNCWIGVESLIQNYLEPGKKQFYEDDIEFKKFDKALSAKIDASEVNLNFHKNSSLEEENLINQNILENNNQENIILNKRRKNSDRNLNITNFNNDNFNNSYKYLNFDYIIEWDKSVIIFII